MKFYGLDKFYDTSYQVKNVYTLVFLLHLNLPDHTLLAKTQDLERSMFCEI